MPRGSNAPLEVFLDLIFPWEDEHKNLFKSVSWTFTTKEGKPGFANYGAQTYDDLIRLVENRINRATNVYLALGAYRMADTTKSSSDGFPRIVRKVSNVVSLKSIYFDIDVGKQGAYATTDDAFAALDDFCDVIGMPAPTIEILSGSGGVHVYWCTKDPMPLASWLPLATALRDAALNYGLKFDQMVTIDAARILRVPGSFNYKSVDAKPVLMMEDSSFTSYSYQELVSALQKYIGNTLHGVRQPLHNMNYTQNFTDNLHTAPPVSIDDVAVNCGVISDILDREGDGDQEPLWNQAILLSSFTDNPTDAAHRMSRGDPRYVYADTEQKLIDKVNARAANPNLGWPACSTFSTLHTACQTCPLFAQGKSPLAFARRPQPHVAPQPAPGADDLMPPGYWRDVNKHVFTAHTLKDGSSVVIDVLGYPILTAGVDPTDEQHSHIVIKTVIGSVEHWGKVTVSSGLSPQNAAEALAKGASIYVKPVNFTHARDFLVSWMTHLQTVKKTIAPASYGWTKDGTGFTFDKTTYLESGAAVAYRGNTFDDRFAVYGKIEPWQDAMKLVYGNRALETIVATSFAAPLVHLCGSASLVVSAYSPRSGVGKTTAMMLAQAVWGDPRTGMSSLNDTTNSVMKKINDLQSLPLYWDELHTSEQLEKAMDLVFAVTQGKGKSRLTRDIAQAKINAFTTMFVVASNAGISDTVYAHTGGTEAGGLRVFELETEQELNHTSFDNTTSRQMLRKTEVNYGAAGAAYAAYIAEHRKALSVTLDSVSKELDKRHKFDSKERFWQMAMTTIMVGARLANRCGLTAFSVKDIDAYLADALRRQRDVLVDEGATTMAAPDSGSLLLQELMAELRGRNLLFTNRINYGAGRPHKIEHQMDTDISRLGDLWMQAGILDGRIRIRRRPFDEWCRKRKLNPRTVIKMIERDYLVTVSKAAIGMGVSFVDHITKVAGGRTPCYDLTPLNVPYSTPGGPGQ